MKKPMVLTLLGLLVVFGGVFGWYNLKQYFIKKYFSTFTPPPQTISTVVASYQKWQPYLNSVGSVFATNSVDISSEVAGQIKQIYFTSGQLVTKGTALIQLDDASEKAQLEEIKAQLQLAQSNFDRTKNLYQQKATTKSAFDDAASKLKQLKAGYENVTSNIAKKLIRAPFDGKIGISQVDLGQYVSAGLVCASLQAQNAFNVKFSLPQQDIKNIFLKQKVSVFTDAYPDDKFEGYVSAIDSKVDENTRTIEVEATVENTNNKLYPGMFVNLNIYLTPNPNTIVLPQTAITYTLYGDSAFVVTLLNKKDSNNYELGTVKRVFVKTDDKQENKVVILEGIKAGDIVVNSGQSKLEDGSSVAINNSNPL
jgi:membrane fusion protein (multidrug efflux system)